MGQIHRRFSDEQVKVLLQSYCQRKITRSDLQDMLGIEKSRFFALWRAYRQDRHNFSITYRRTTPARLSAKVETEIQTALLREKQIVEDPNLPISDYNYTALRDRLKNKGIEVSVTTIIDRAKKLGCYKARKKNSTIEKCSPHRSVLWSSTTALLTCGRLLPKRNGP